MRGVDTRWMDIDNQWAGRADQHGLRPDNSGRLAAMRRWIMSEAIESRGGKPVTVDLYALGVDPVATHLRTRTYAAKMGWRDGVTFDDPYATSDPMQRPGWSKLCQRLSGGYAHGVVVVGQSDITTDIDEYEMTLHWMQHHCVFVDFVLPHRPAASYAQSTRRKARGE
ncbi:hypothetical protein [Streptomyces sp. NPDC059928]|uniref:hypothetical protein n=1 Tax=unclassified Streptomyces TaxID=2593676 RepID=UPI00365810CC